MTGLILGRRSRWSSAVETADIRATGRTWTLIRFPGWGSNEHAVEFSKTVAPLSPEGTPPLRRVPGRPCYVARFGGGRSSIARCASEVLRLEAHRGAAPCVRVSRRTTHYIGGASRTSLPRRRWRTDALGRPCRPHPAEARRRHERS